MSAIPAIDLNGAAHVVQLALTPIFLLTGVASLLNVFSTRMGRVADKVAVLRHDPGQHREQLRRLRLRSRFLDTAVLLASLAGGLTCAAALTLFVGALRNAAAATLLFSLFGGAVICSTLALMAFSVETVISGRTVREQAEGGGRTSPD